MDVHHITDRDGQISFEKCKQVMIANEEEMIVRQIHVLLVDNSDGIWAVNQRMDYRAHMGSKVFIEMKLEDLEARAGNSVIDDIERLARGVILNSEGMEVSSREIDQVQRNWRRAW